MSLAGAIFLVVGFVALVRIFGLIRKCGDVFDLVKSSLAVLRNPSLDDDAKESALRSYATRLFSLFLFLTLGAALALALPAAVIWILDVLQVVSLRAVIDVTLSWQFLLGTRFSGSSPCDWPAGAECAFGRDKEETFEPALKWRARGSVRPPPRPIDLRCPAVRTPVGHRRSFRVLPRPRAG